MFPPLTLSLSSNSCFLFDPVSQLSDAWVDAGLVPTCAALTPTHYASLEPLPTFLETHQGASRVSLVSTIIKRGEGERTVIILTFGCEGTIITWVWKPIYSSPFSFLSCRILHNLTWHASTPPAKKPLQSILDVTWPSVTVLQIVSLMIFTDAFCKAIAAWPAKCERKKIIRVSVLLHDLWSLPSIKNSLD